MRGLVVSYGSQVEVGRRLGYTQAAINKVVTRAEVGFGLRNALLAHLEIDAAELVRRYGPRGAMPFIGDVREKGFETRSTAVMVARKRGICDDALRMVVTDPAFNRAVMRGESVSFWSKKLDALHEAITGKPAPHPKDPTPAPFRDGEGRIVTVTKPHATTKATKASPRRAG